MCTLFCQIRWLKLTVLSGLVAVSSMASPDWARARDTSTELTEKMVAALHSPSTAAELIHTAVTANPQTAEATATTAIQVAPAFAALLTAAAVHSAPQHTADIMKAMAVAAPKLAQKIQISANVAAALTAQPDQSDTVIGAEVVSQPELAATIVTASATVCNLLHGCPHTSIEKLVQAAIAADREVAEVVVGAAVYLVPGQAGAIIAAADEALATSLQVEEQTAPTATEALLLAPSEPNGFSALQPMKAEPSISSQVVASQEVAPEAPLPTVVTRVRARAPLPDLSQPQTSAPRATPVVVNQTQDSFNQAQDRFDDLMRTAAARFPLTNVVDPFQQQAQPEQQPGQGLQPPGPGVGRQVTPVGRQPAPRPFPASPFF